MADYIFTQHGNNNVQIGGMTGMPYHVNTALKWALEHNFQSVAAQYSKTLALEVVRLREDNERLCAALQSSKKRAADYEQTGLCPDDLTDLRRRAENNQVCYVSEAAECERLRIELAAYKARWTETASDNTEYTLAHLDGIYTVCDPDGCVVCEFIRGAALEGGPQ